MPCFKKDTDNKGKSKQPLENFTIADQNKNRHGVLLFNHLRTAT